MSLPASTPSQRSSSWCACILTGGLFFLAGLVPGCSLFEESSDPNTTLRLVDAGYRYPVGTRPYAVVVDDFDGDGVMDVATANEGGSTVSVLLGLAAGGFAADTEYAVGSAPDALCAGDLNGDGFSDLATADTGSDSVSVLPGLGDGTFGEAVLYALELGSQPWSISSGDLNGDGFMDLFTADYGLASVSVLLGGEDGIFSAAFRVGAGAGVRSVRAADFDRDGILDLCTADRTDNTVTILYGTGQGTFLTGEALAVGVNPSMALPEDLNGDGWMDMVVTCPGSNEVWTLLGGGESNVYADAGRFRLRSADAFRA